MNWIMRDIAYLWCIAREYANLSIHYNGLAVALKQFTPETEWSVLLEFAQHYLVEYERRDVATRLCRKCTKEKLLKEFYRGRRVCMECHRGVVSAAYHANPERKKAYNRAYTKARCS